MWGVKGKVSSGSLSWVRAGVTAGVRNAERETGVGGGWRLDFVPVEFVVLGRPLPSEVDLITERCWGYGFVDTGPTAEW